MFSSITKKYSPKRLLATYLANSLAEFFVINPEKIETNLVNDSKIILCDVALKEQKIIKKSSTTTISGSVERIEFSWTWDTTLLITNVNLTIQGITVYVDSYYTTTTTTTSSLKILAATTTTNDDDNDDTKQEDGDDEEVVVTPPPTNTTTTTDDWKTKYLQQIIDHLTLIVTDVTVSIRIQKHHDDDASEEKNDDDDDDSKQVIFVVQGKDMELKTLTTTTTGAGAGEAKSENSLLQSLYLKSIEAWIEEEQEETATTTKTTTKYPIVEPFGYDASIQRISGRRFFDGVLSGLFVQGNVT